MGKVRVKVQVRWKKGHPKQPRVSGLWSEQVR